MRRLIDVSVLTEKLNDLCDAVCQYSISQRAVMCGACPLGDAFDVLENVPTLDAVTVKVGCGYLTLVFDGNGDEVTE